MESLIDPCNPYLVSSGCILMSGLIIFFQMLGFCIPVLDYLKFTAISILMYFYYETVIKMKKPLCGFEGTSMWSSMSLCMFVSTLILAALCIRLRQAGEAIGYIALIFCVLPYTLCCMSRLYFEKGPFNAGFWNPTTITKMYV